MSHHLTDDGLGLVIGSENYAYGDLERAVAWLGHPERVQELMATGCPIVNAELASLERLVGLKALYLDETTIGNDGLVFVGRLWGLETLHLGMTQTAERIDMSGVRHLLGLKKLVYLNLDGQWVTAFMLTQLAELPSLRSLSASFTFVDDAGLKAIGDLTALQMLCLHRTCISDDGLPHLLRLTDLQVLDAGNLCETRLLLPLGELMHQMSEPGAIPPALSEASGFLVSLDRWPPEHIVPNPGITNAGLAILGRMRSLQRLYLLGAKVDDDGIVHLAELPALEVLALNETGLGDDGLEALSRLPALKELFARKTRITDLGLAHLEPHLLRVLSAGDNDITNRGLAKLASFGQLHTSLEEIDLGSTAVNDAGAAHLALFRGLRVLCLEECPISDDALYHLIELKELHFLDLEHTEVSSAGLALIVELEIQFLLLSRTGVGNDAVEYLTLMTSLIALHLAGNGISEEVEARLWDELPNLRVLVLDEEDRGGDDGGGRGGKDDPNTPYPGQGSLGREKVPAGARSNAY